MKQKQNIEEAKAMTRTEIMKKIEEQLVKMIKEMEKYHCITVKTEIAESGEMVYNLDKDENFQPDAYQIFDIFARRASRQTTEMKIGDFHHINYILYNIVINFWDCN